MKTLSLISIFTSAFISTLASAAPTGKLNCQAVYKTINANDQAEVQALDMPAKYEGGNYFRYETNLNNRNFSVSEDQSSDSYLAQITKAPSYTEGLVMRGSADKNGVFTAASVENRQRIDAPANGEIPARTSKVSDLYKIICKKISQ